MRVDVDEQTLELIGVVRPPDGRPRDEEALLWAEPVDPARVRVAGALPEGLDERCVGDLEPAQVGDVLAEGEAAAGIVFASDRF